MTVIPTILVQSKLVHQLYIMSTSWFTSITSCDVKFSPGFDWSTATKLKPKFETAQNATFSLTIFFFQTPGWAFSCFARKRPVSLWPGTETKMAAVLRFGRASTCLRQQNCKEILCAFMLCFFCVLNPLFCAFACI